MLKSAIVNTFDRLGFILNRKKKIDHVLYKKLYSVDSLTERNFYNIGAGNFRHPYWTNIDNPSEWYLEDQKNNDYISYDLLSLEPFPISSDTAEIVYSSHVIEHITDAAAQNMFNEAYRILKKDGVFRFYTPNIELSYRAVKNNDRDFYYWIDNYSTQKEMNRIKIKQPMNQTSIKQIFLFSFASQVSELSIIDSINKISDKEIDRVFNELSFNEALNYCTSKCSIEWQNVYPGYHINWWSKEKAFKMLKQAGFKNINLSAFGQSFSPVLRKTHMFDNTNPKISLYIEAIK